MKSKFAALDTTIIEVDWLREPLMDLHIAEKPLSVILKVNNSKDNIKLSRYVKSCLKLVRKMRNSRVISLDYISTNKNLADQFTKLLLCNVIDNALKEMRMRPI